MRAHMVPLNPLSSFLLLLVAAEAPSAEMLWEIGKADGRRDDFALGAETAYDRFSQRFGAEMDFQVGLSESAKDFPFVLPGPADAWAGGRPHVLKIRFDLADPPSGAYLFTLRLCLTHYEVPPAIGLFLNGTAKEVFDTPKSAQGFAKLWKLPTEALHKGANEISIRNGRGSWAEFDSLRLDRFPGGDLPDLITGLALSDTILFREVDGKLSQIVRARVDGLWDGRGTFKVRAAGVGRAIDAAEARSPQGGWELPVGAIEGPVEVECELVTACGARASGKITVRPHRRWRIYTVMKTHYDLGYTHPVDAMLRSNADWMLDKVMAFCDGTRGNPPGSRFIWNYPSWLVGKLRELLGEEKRRRFEEYIRRGEISWSGLPFTLHSYFCGLEDIVRSVYFSAALDREFGTTVRWAKQTDVPGHTRVLPQVLAKSGIRLLQIGANNAVRGIRIPLLFYWESPDGSRILTEFTPSYGFGYDEGLLLGLEADPAYPFDAFLAFYITGDNVGPADLDTVAALARDMNSRYAFPKFQIGKLEDFADHIEKNFAGKVPVVKAENTDWWIHGVASMARETALAREARERLTASEKANTFALLLDPAHAYPAARFWKAYEQSLLFSEHTWGVAGFKPKPLPPGQRDLETNQSDPYKAMRRSWEVKGDYARAAAAIAGETLAGGLAAAAKASGTIPGSLLVFNPLNWKRSDLVRMPRAGLPSGPFILKDRETGAVVPWQPDGGEVVFVARDVPPCGWAAYSMESGGEAPAVRSRSSGDPLLTAGGFRAAFDLRIGAATSLWADGVELIDPSCPHGLGQFVYEASGKAGDAGYHGSPYDGPGTGRRSPSLRSWRIEEGPVLSRFIAEGDLEFADFPVEVGSTGRTVQMLSVPRGLGFVECEVRLEGKRPTALSEMGHVAFPFQVPEGKFRLELLGSVADPEKDLQDGGNRDAFAVQHWVDVSNGERGITWCPIEATITSLGGIRLFQWDPRYVPQNPWIYSNAFNNGWSTNFQEWQGGDFRFRYRFRPHKGGFVEGGAPRFGWETAQPLVPVLVAAVPPGAPQAPSASAARRSFILAEGGTTVLLNLKRAEDGKGIIARLFETCGKADEVRISLPGRTIRSASKSLATELSLPGEGAGRLEIRDGAATVPVGPWSIETVRLEL